MTAHRPAVATAETLEVVDAIAGGDVGRVVIAGVDISPALSVGYRARILRERADGVRRALIEPPVGDPAHSINICVPPSDPDAQIGLIICGTMGYPGFSGSNTMCTIAALNAAGRLPLTGEVREIGVETPAGVTRVRAHRDAGGPVTVSYAAPAGTEIPVRGVAEVPGHGPVEYALIGCGPTYVVVDGDSAGFEPHEVTPARMRQLFDPLLEHASALVRAADAGGETPAVTLGLLAEPVWRLAGPAEGRPRRVPVAVYMAGGVVCAGPTGTGSTALLTWLAGRARIGVGDSFRVESPAGNTFDAMYLGTDLEGGEPGRVRTRITGTAQVLGRSAVRLSLD